MPTYPSILIMAIMNLPNEAMTDETSDMSSSKKLEKSLDAVSALRKAMEQRLAEAKAARAAIELSVAKPEKMAPPVEVVTAIVTQAETPTPAPAPATLATAAVSAELTTPVVQPQPKAEKTQTTEAPAKDSSTKTTAPQSETPIRLDPVEWSQIMMHVAERSQDILRSYAERMRHKRVDTASFSAKPILESLSKLTSRFIDDPEAYANAHISAWQNYLDITRATLMRMQGFKTKPVVETAPTDKRFKASDWQTNWMFDFLKQSYLSTSEEVRRLIKQEASQVESRAAQKMEFYSRLFLDATAPNNFWMTNPEVLRVTLETKGENLIKGLENLLDDMETGNGMLRIRMSDYRTFELGKNLASTPGKVVYQNELMQLIQYSPSTATVRKVPLLIVPPWINKYYILDLSQKNSFVRNMVEQGHTVFCISWVNPTKAHANVNFEDYMETGALTAMREIKRLTGEDSVNTLGYCIGGTLMASLQAYLAAKPEPDTSVPKIASSTYLVTMVDFEQPGDLGVFIDEEQIRMIENRMEKQGFMDAGSMMMTFNMLRPNDLIWPFIINNYMLGREPFPFDILYWNTDSTNLPAAMQSYYLRNMYLNNKLIEPGTLKMKGVPLDLAEISTPSFLLAAREDHIAPWKSTYAATQYYKGSVTFVLAGSGHIAGVINPPATGKYGYWTNSQCPTDPDEWLKGATEHKGSWWPEWAKWLDQYAGENIPARAVTEGIEDAPGSYVKERAA